MVVARADETGIATLGANRLAIHATDIAGRFLEEMFDEGKLLLAQLVELVDVDEEETAE